MIPQMPTSPEEKAALQLRAAAIKSAQAAVQPPAPRGPQPLQQNYSYSAQPQAGSVSYGGPSDPVKQPQQAGGNSIAATSYSPQRSSANGQRPKMPEPVQYDQSYNSPAVQAQFNQFQQPPSTPRVDPGVPMDRQRAQVNSFKMTPFGTRRQASKSQRSTSPYRSF